MNEPQRKPTLIERVELAIVTIGRHFDESNGRAMTPLERMVMTGLEIIVFMMILLAVLFLGRIGFAILVGR